MIRLFWLKQSLIHYHIAVTIAIYKQFIYKTTKCLLKFKNKTKIMFKLLNIALIWN